MKRLVLAAAAITAMIAATPAWAALAVGAVAPDVTADAFQDGKPVPFSLKEALKKGPVVLYFFPAAYTPGCNIEAREFGEAIGDFKAAGATVIGVTMGNTERLAEFSKEHCNGKFPVASVSEATINAYDVKSQFMGKTYSNRTSFVIGRNGKIVGAHTEMGPTGHITSSLATVRSLKKG